MSDLKRALVAVLQAYERLEAEQREMPPGTFALTVIPGTCAYVVRNDDVKRLEMVAAGVLAAWGWGVASDYQQLMALGGTAILALRFLTVLIRKGATLDPLQTALTIALKATPDTRPRAWSAEELSARLNATIAAGEREWSLDEVQEALASLTKVRVRDGNTLPFVAQASDGLWSALA